MVLIEFSLYRFIARLVNPVFVLGVLMAFAAPAMAQMTPPNLAMAPIAPSVSAPKTKIALLLPLSGNAAPLAAAMQNAAIMGLFAANNPNLAIVPYDTGGRADEAGVAAQKAAAEGATVILGPLFSAEINAVSGGAPNLPVLSFSNDWTMAGKNIFIYGMTPQYDVAALMPYLESRGVRMVHVLYPQNAFGKAVFDTVKSISARGAVALATDGGFNPQNPKSLRSAIDKIKNALPKNQQAELNRYHAIIIGESAPRLSAINAALTESGIAASDVPIAGTSQFADVDYSNLPSLIGAFYPALDPRAHAQFASRYQSYFGQNPPAMAAMAFDAVGLLAVSPDAWRAGQPMPVTGGLVRFGPAQIAERKMTVVNSNGGQILQN